MTTETTSAVDVVERLRSLGACEPGCNGRCKECPDNVGRNGADEITRLRTALATAEQRADKAEGKMMEWRKAFHSVVPGGSEYMTPQSCVDYIREEKTRRHETICKFVRQAKAAERERDEAREMLKSIKQFGEPANVACGSQFYTGGKKPASKDVWQFPRHMLTELDRILKSPEAGKDSGERP